MLGKKTQPDQRKRVQYERVSIPGDCRVYGWPGRRLDRRARGFGEPKVTELVVRTGSSELSARLVPVDRVAESSHDTIRLNSTIYELEQMQLFYEAHYIRDDMGPEAAYMYYSSYHSIQPVDIPIMEFASSGGPAGDPSGHAG